MANPMKYPRAPYTSSAPLALRSIVLAAAALCSAPLAWAQTPPAADAAVSAAAAAESAVENSRLDAPLFYQVLKGELELRLGEPGNAYELILDAARRTRDESLFRRAMDIALQSRALEQAYAATRSWRNSVPQSQDALRFQVQLLLALGRSSEIGEPMRSLLALAPADARWAARATREVTRSPRRAR